MESSKISREARLSISTIESIDSTTSSITPCPTLVYTSTLAYNSEKTTKENFESKNSSSDDLESKTGLSDCGETITGAMMEEDEWTFDDQGLRGILVIFVSFFFSFPSFLSTFRRQLSSCATKFQISASNRSSFSFF